MEDKQHQPSNVNTTPDGVATNQKSILDISSNAVEAKVGNQTTASSNFNQPPTTFDFDFDALRLSTNYGEGFAVKKMITMVRVGRPHKEDFFRTHHSPEYRFPGLILEVKEHSEIFLLTQQIGNVLPRLCRAVQLHTAIDRDNNISLIPVPLPNEEGVRNPWHESLAIAVVEAETKWIRLEANKKMGRYQMSEPLAKLPDPEWPDMPMEEILKIAFRDRIISSLDHPVVQKLLGAI